MDDEDFIQRLDAIDQEPDEAKRTGLISELFADLDQDAARATVELVEQVRARSGDDAAMETLRALRNQRRK